MPKQQPAPHEPAQASSSPIRLDTRLIRGMSEEGVGELLARFKNAAIVRECVVKVLTKELDHAIIKSESEEVLDSPNALAVLSRLAGKREALRDCIRLLTHTDKEMK